MLKGGFELSHRLLSYPKPVVMACTGHAIAMGAFLLASGDHRISAPGYNIQANEVAIGMTIPYSALEVMKLRLTPAAYQQSATLAKTFFGETAVASGWIDEIVMHDMVLSRAEEAAREFATLKQHAHVGTKLRTRADALAGIRAGIDNMAAEFEV
jgi:enoyl-CoA hydratase